MDFNKYQNTYEYPSKESIKKDLMEKYDPDNQRLTRSEYAALLSSIESEAKDIYNKHCERYYEQKRKNNDMFFTDMAEDIGYSDLPDRLISLINSDAWDRGHSYGYSEVYSYAEDIATMVENVYNLGVEHGRKL